MAYLRQFWRVYWVQGTLACTGVAGLRLDADDSLVEVLLHRSLSALSLERGSVLEGSVVRAQLGFLQPKQT